LVGKPDDPLAQNPEANRDSVVSQGEAAKFEQFKQWMDETSTRLVDGQPIEQFVSLERDRVVLPDNNDQGYLPSYATYRAAVEELVNRRRKKAGRKHLPLA
jgi:hypothetical protein